MSNKPRLIIWSKWKDPFAVDLNQTDDASDLDSSDEDDDRLPYEIIEDDKYYKFSPTLTNGPNVGKNMKVVNTPAGLLPLNDECYPSKTFNLWIGHTNFNITPDIVNTIANIEGVEGFRPVSRYRFEVAIGLAFKSSEVKKSIQDVVCGSPLINTQALALISSQTNEEISSESATKLELLRKNVSEKYWVAFVLPNGHIDLINGNEVDESFYEKFSNFCHTQILVGGAIYTSDTLKTDKASGV